MVTTATKFLANFSMKHVCLKHQIPFKTFQVVKEPLSSCTFDDTTYTGNISSTSNPATYIHYLDSCCSSKSLSLISSLVELLSLSEFLELGASLHLGI